MLSKFCGKLEKKLPYKFYVLGQIQYDRKLLRIAFFKIKFIPVSLVNLLHIGILRKECNK